MISLLANPWLPESFGLTPLFRHRRRFHPLSRLEKTIRFHRHSTHNVSGKVLATGSDNAHYRPRAPCRPQSTRWRIIPLLVSLLVLTLSGCSRFSTEYGASEGPAGMESLNGFGAFRTALQHSPAGVGPAIESHDVARLSLREAESDAIVWIPASWSPSNLQEIMDWLDRWLAQDNRTLVFIVPGEGSTEAYFQEAAGIAPPEQRLNYRRRLAELINEHLLAEATRVDVRLGNWFTANPLPNRVTLPDRQLLDFSIAEPTATTMAGQKPTEDLRFEPLDQERVSLANGSTSLTTLARITRERWKSSQVLVVASGSMLTNFAMTGDAAPAMASEIQHEIRRASDKAPESKINPGAKINVGFLASRFGPIPVSDATPEIPKTRGWELMTEMPLSLINLHVAFLGIVLCLMLLPVFGRARHVRYHAPTHFGNHLSAMATLMRRSGGTDYAKRQISEYLRRVRGETSGPWVLPPEDAADSEHPSQSQP